MPSWARSMGRGALVGLTWLGVYLAAGSLVDRFADRLGARVEEAGERAIERVERSERVRELNGELRGLANEVQKARKMNPFGVETETKAK